MDLTSLLLAALLAVSAAPWGARGAAGQPPPPNDPDLATAEDPSQWKEENEFTPFVGDRFDGFDWRLCKEVARLAPRHANVVLSPVSVKLLLAMLYEGAAGDTAAELENALQLSRLEPPARRPEARRRFSNIVAALQQPNPDFKLDLALRMFVDDTFAPRTRYNKILRYFYNVELETVDFELEGETANNINAWVNKSTMGFIKDLVKADDLRDVQMMLANAVFLDGKWLAPFSEDETAEAVFFSRPGYAYNTSFMTQISDFYYYNSSAVGAQILRLPYKGGKYSMFVVLPHERDGLEGVLEQLSPDRVRQLMWNMTLVEVRVFLPRFAFDTRTDMKQVLRAMGVRTMFERAADLQGIVPRRQGPLFVSSVVQKALVQVNEKGTVAAAATEASTTNRFGGSTKNVFSARHPFLFFIEDEATATVLFVGKVSEPHPAADGAQPPQPSDPGSPEVSDFDLSSRFGGGDFDHRRPPVIVTNTIGGGGADDPRWRPVGRPESTTPQPDARRPPQPQPQPQPLPLPPFNFNWLWRPNLYAGRTPAATLPQAYTPTHTYNAQNGAGGGPQLFLVPLYVPIR
ncbi:hypothetical protein R5R35_006965 [Gryllus longicercus]|uniref:Serpin domain-containing protein n=1 Tax=Gryllus longicercus TaxID=2509291 RepID=A0AAN9VVL3_9ORTH